ncbi:MAG: glutamate racemase, partial [Rhizobium oryzihabitans]
VPLPQDAEHPDGFDFAVFTSGKPDFATRRLMQGFGLSVSLG